MSTISIELNEHHLNRFRESARLLGLTPEELAADSIQKMLDRNESELDQVIHEIIEERQEVLKRLAL
jgi:hypothetical protein